MSIEVKVSLDTLKMALEALKSSNKLINGTGTKFGLDGAMDGYYRGCFDVDGNNKLLKEAITALRQAIEQASKQEPVAWIEHHKAGDNLVWDEPHKGTPLYTSPPPVTESHKRQPLTDEQIEHLIFRSGGHKSTQNLMSNPMQVREYVELWNERIYKFARAIEAAHGITGEQK